MDGLAFRWLLGTALPAVRDLGVPEHAEDELVAAMACGDPTEGFLWMSCDACGVHRVVSTSCKGRGFWSCATPARCGGRRMAQGAAHLVDEVLPVAPVRQWVLSLPMRVVVRERRRRPLVRRRPGGGGFGDAPIEPLWIGGRGCPGTLSVTTAWQQPNQIGFATWNLGDHGLQACGAPSVTVTPDPSVATRHLTDGTEAWVEVEPGGRLGTAEGWPVDAPALARLSWTRDNAAYVECE